MEAQPEQDLAAREEQSAYSSRGKKKTPNFANGTVKEDVICILVYEY
jgi:hypothetical protein